MKIFFIKIITVSSLLLLVSGCTSRIKHQDLLSDRLEKERIYTAMKNYSDLIKINKEKLQKKDTVDNRLRLAQNYYDIEDFDSALYYIAPLILQGKDSRAFLLQAKILESQNLFEESLKAAQRVIALDSKNAEVYNLIGIIKTKTKEFDIAKENFLKAKGLFLADDMINNNLGMLMILTNRFDDAINYLLPLYHRNFKDRKIINNLVLALIKAGKKEQALEIVKKQRISRSPDLFLKDLEKLENILEIK